MAFRKDLLAEHERVVFDIRPHWIAIVPSVLWTIGLVATWAGGYTLAKGSFDDPTVAQNVVAIVVLLSWAWLALIPFYRWRFTTFVLTSDRLITRSGIVAKHLKEIPLERINDVAFSQSVLERALGAGDLMIESAGERGQTVVENVRKPEEMQLLIYKESDGLFSPTVWSDRPGASVVEQIEALARLKENGVLSPGEFESKKKELLDRL